MDFVYCPSLDSFPAANDLSTVELSMAILSAQEQHWSVCHPVAGWVKQCSFTTPPRFPWDLSLWNSSAFQKGRMNASIRDNTRCNGMLRTKRSIQTQFPSPRSEPPLNQLETGESQTLKTEFKFFANSMLQCPWVPDPRAMGERCQASLPVSFLPLWPPSPWLWSIAGLVGTWPWLRSAIPLMMKWALSLIFR